MYPPDRTARFASESEIFNALAAGFEGNEAAAAPVGVDGSTAHIVVRVPGLHSIPKVTTQGTRGKVLRFRPLTDLEVDALYTETICGYVVATATQAAAIAPSLDAIHVIAVRENGGDVEVMMAARFASSSLRPRTWKKMMADEVVSKHGTDLVASYAGPHSFISPIDLRSEPELRELLRHITTSG